MAAVERTLQELELHTKPCITVFNKIDLLPSGFVEQKVRRHGGIGISAINPRTLEPLILAMQEHVADFVPAGASQESALLDRLLLAEEQQKFPDPEGSGVEETGGKRVEINFLEER
jgi:50S ribosomal subunit-associated GTPase HflX